MFFFITFFNLSSKANSDNASTLGIDEVSYHKLVNDWAKEMLKMESELWAGHNS